jgi:hypothetical protein
MGAQHVADLLSRHATGKPDRAAVHDLGTPLHLGEIGPDSRDDQLDTRHRPGNVRERVEQREDALAVLHTVEEQHRRPWRRRGARREARRIDAVRDLEDAATMPLGLVDAAARRGRGDEQRGRAPLLDAPHDAFSALHEAGSQRQPRGSRRWSATAATNAPRTSGVSTPTSARLSPVKTGFIWWITSKGACRCSRSKSCRIRVHEHQPVERGRPARERR